jgi:hypothetical protein
VARVARGHRRRTRVAGVLAGAILAAGGGLLYAAVRPATPAAAGRPTASAVSPAVHRTAAMPMGGPAAPDLVVRDGRLEIPFVDSIELLPGCHP